MGLYFQDLSDEQLDKVVEMLRADEEVVDPNLEVRLQNEEIDDWMNRHNNSEMVLDCLGSAYE